MTRSPLPGSACRVQRLAADRVRIYAPAKINLTLSVAAPGDDGFHPLDSIVARIDYCDELVVSARHDGQILGRVIGALDVPVEDNLITRAARSLKRRSPADGVDLTLTKHIPPGAGLGGGSSDAAATLIALNQIWGLHMAPDELSALAAGLGSDVPLFLAPPTVRMTGRGEIVEPIALPQFAAVLLCPPIHSDTAAVYRRFDAMGAATSRACDPTELARTPVARWDPLLVNDLEAPATAEQPAIAEWAERLSRAAGRPAHMTGSGSALFVLAETPAEAGWMHRELPDELRRCARAVTVSPV